MLEWFDLLNEPKTVRWLFIAFSGGAAALLSIVVVHLGYELFSPSSRRIKQLRGTTTDKSRMQPFLQWLKHTSVDIAKLFTPTKGREVNRISDQLEFIGYTQPNALKLFFGSKFLLGSIAGVLMYLVARYFPDYSPFQVMIACGTASFIGMLIPNKVLERLCQKRRDLYRRGFPDSLDLLLVCVEAGLGLNAAILRVSKELVVSHPLLSEQYTVVNEEIRVGIDRVQALRNFAARTQLEDAENLVSLLAQSMKYGTSVAETLRVYAAELRDKRIQSAEEQAAMIGTKLIFPLVLCIFPSFFIVIIGPAILGVMKALS